MTDENLTPSAKIIRKSNEIKSVKDSEGRLITYKTLKPSDQLEMVTLIGVDRSVNPITISMCSATFRALTIDGIPLHEPQDYEDVKTNMDLLGDEGLSALYDAFRGTAEKKDDGEKMDKKAKATKE